MPGKVTLRAEKGPIEGQVFEFDEPDIFVFGRGKDCHARLPEDDRTASRHHFIMDINPPSARVRDLGSLNGTYVNETKHGGRDLNETPEEASRRNFPVVELEDFDKIRVGETILSVEVRQPAWCHKCHQLIPGQLYPRGTVGILFTCEDCERKAAEPKLVTIEEEPMPVRCGECGKDVSNEVGPGPRGDYVCNSCRSRAQKDPLGVLLRHLMGKMGIGESAPGEFPGYSIERTLGKGGMGKVYLARRKEDGKHVAIKVMLSQVAVNEDTRKRFLREAEETAKMEHPNCVEFYEAGSAGPGFYFVIEYCPGGSVDLLMARRGGTLSVDEARSIMLDSLAGLSHIHQRGTIHRDVKPHNIVLTHPDGGVAKLMDFGLSKNFEEKGLSGGLTQTGMYAGTPQFLPREQIINFKRVKPVTDIWGMVATFYHMLTGRFPLDFPPGRDPMEVILSDTPTPIRKRSRSVPKPLAKVIDRSLAVETNKRYQTAAEFRDALQAVL